MLTRLMLLTLLCGCGGKVDSDEPKGPLPPGSVARSGSRLRLRFLETADGARLPVGFHDTELDVDCSPRPDRNGVIRCLPDVVRTPGTFVDASCTVRGVSDCMPPPRYASTSSSTCPDKSDLAFFEIGERADRSFFPSAGGACVATSSSEPVYAVGSTDVTERFAAFEEQRRRLGARIDAIVYVAPDGAEWLSARLFDRQLGLECTPSAAADGTRRCLPGSSADPFSLPTGTLVFGDASCSKLLVAGISCGEPRIVLKPELCVGSRVFRATRRVDAASFWMTPGGCSPYPTTPSSLFEAEELAPRELALVTQSPTKYGIDIAIVDGRPVGATTHDLHDPATGEACVLMHDAAGTLRCTPPTEVWFADSACSQPVAVVAKDACALPKRVHLPLLAACGEPGVAAVFDVGKEITSPGPMVFTRSSDGSCFGAKPTADDRVFESHPLPLDAVPAYRLVTD